MSKLLKRLWHSPTLMTLGSYASRSLSIIIVLPLLLTRLSTEEISLWYLFSTVIAMQMLADVGFNATFSRSIAYAMGGATYKDIQELSRASIKNNNGQPNWQTIEQICSTMRAIYLRLSLIAFILFATLGTYALLKPISASVDKKSAWIAWGVILLVSIFTLFGNIYSAYLQGINQIALLRRWEVFTSLGAILTSFIVLLLGSGLLGLVIANQSWLVINIVRNRWLCRRVENSHFQHFKRQKIEPEIFEVVWPSAWRSGLGVFMTYGLVQLSSIVYAQISSASEIASYLLALRLIQIINQFSQAPFYSKLPILARLRSEGKLAQQVLVAKRGMALAYWIYVIGVLILGIFATPLLKFIGSNAEFVNPLLWSLMGLAIFAERYGAMHIQLYSTTNHIIWHIATGATGIIYIVVSLMLFNQIGVYAFPIATLAGYLSFYCWYSAKHSYSAFGLKFWSFERTTMIAPLSIVIIYFAGTLLSFIYT
jgi:O-antigen/teichoic acid export membrane protein